MLDASPINTGLTEHAMEETHMRENVPAHSRVTRRMFLGPAASAGTVVGAGFLGARSAYAREDDDRQDRRANPNAIPETIAPFAPFAIQIHHLPPTPGIPVANINEPSQITDFSGFVGLTRIRGGGTGIDTRSGQTQARRSKREWGLNRGSSIETDGARLQGR